MTNKNRSPEYSDLTFPIYGEIIVLLLVKLDLRDLPGHPRDTKVYGVKLLETKFGPFPFIVLLSPSSTHNLGELLVSVLRVHKRPSPDHLSLRVNIVERSEDVKTF